MLLRWLVGLPLAALITTALFWMMSYLIKQETRTNKPREYQEITITAELPPETPEPVKVPRPDHPEPPEPVDTLPDTTRQLPTNNPGGVSGIDGIAEVEPGEIITVGPTIPVPPQYPPRCVQKGAEGLVIVEFDVTAQGQVVNARIISSPDSCFDRAVLRAIEKWRYAPNMVNGLAAPRSNVREQFRFELEG